MLFRRRLFIGYFVVWFKLHNNSIVPRSIAIRRADTIDMKLSIDYHDFQNGQLFFGRHHFEVHSLEWKYWPIAANLSLKSHWNVCLRVQITISQYWFEYWLGADKVTSHNLNQRWSSSSTHVYVSRPNYLNNCDISRMMHQYHFGTF